jgi:PTS system mannitol-specific IIC component
MITLDHRSKLITAVEDAPGTAALDRHQHSGDHMSLPDAAVNKNLEGRGVRASVQRFGGFLAGMIMPNIGAFIAWGLITALFIPAGWMPNSTLAKLGDPMLTYLLPALIAYTGGSNVHGRRGGVIGAIAVMGVIVGADIPMLLGAMIMGPLAAWLLKQFDRLIEGHIKAGFEMLVDTFSIGILGMLLALLGHIGIEPIVTTLMGWLASGVNFLIGHHLLPLASIFIEPAKVLFLNNAINHGILTPLGIEQAKVAGKSILFMVESNPGPGFGLLLAYLIFGARNIRESVPGAIIIHLFGGIHEIYFPYVLMKPKTILATILGAMSGLFVATATGAGLVAPPAPGSIIAWFAMCPRTGYLPMILDFATATVVSFVVASLLIRPDRKKDEAAAAEQDRHQDRPAGRLRHRLPDRCSGRLPHLQGHRRLRRRHGILGDGGLDDEEEARALRRRGRSHPGQRHSAGHHTGPHPGRPGGTGAQDGAPRPGRRVHQLHGRSGLRPGGGRRPRLPPGSGLPVRRRC